MNIVVTGGTGFLGTHLVPRLRALGHSVTVIARSAVPTEWLTGDNPIRQVQADLKNRAAVRDALLGAQALYHLAGLVSFKNEDGRKMYELHVDCTRELLRDVRALGTKPRVILASTSGTIAVSKEPRLGTEDDDYPIEVVGRWPYYLSKIYEEKLALEFCKKEGIPLVVLNPSLLLGPGDERLSSTWTVVKFLQRDIPAMPGGGMSFVDVRDVAEAAVQALTKGELYGRYLMGLNFSMKEFFEKLERLSGVPAPRMALPKQLNIVGAMALEKWAKWRGQKPALDSQEVEVGEHWFWCDSSRAERELGFVPRDAYETLHDTLAYVMAKLPSAHLPGRKGQLAELLGR